MWEECPWHMLLRWKKQFRRNLQKTFWKKADFLTENFLKTGGHLPWILRFLLTHNLLNFLSVPDFVAYKYADRNYSLTTKLCRNLWKAQGVTWTLKTLEEHHQAVREGWIPIFEDYTP